MPSKTNYFLGKALAGILITSFCFLTIPNIITKANTNIQINKTEGSYTFVVSISSQRIFVFDNNGNSVLRGSDGESVAVGLANKNESIANTSDSGYYNMTWFKTPIGSFDVGKGGEPEGGDDAVRVWQLPFGSNCDKTFKPDVADAVSEYYKRKCSRMSQNGYYSYLSIHGSKNFDGYRSHGCIRVSDSTIIKLKNFVNTSNSTRLHIVQDNFSLDNYQFNGRSLQSTTPKTKSDTKINKTTSNLSTNGTNNTPRVPITNRQRTITTPLTQSTPSNSGSDKPKQSCSAIQSEINRIQNNRGAYSNADQQILTRQNKLSDCI